VSSASDANTSTRVNPEQQDGVASVFENLLVMAPVGTGKTTVVTLRAAHAIEAGVAPGSILCLSFTNKAARDLKMRVVPPPSAGKFQVSRSSSTEFQQRPFQTSKSVTLTSQTVSAQMYRMAFNVI
jgi:hypothetical protein